MKKLFTLTAMLALALVANAQDTYRKSWDFTKWSPTTVANLKAEAAKGLTQGVWSDSENDAGTAMTKDISPGNCFWQVGVSTGGITLKANEETIAETEGLVFVNGNARSLAIAVNYGDCTSANGAGFGPYHGGSYLWLGNKKKDYFVIQGVEPGTTIKMGVESHNVTDARGVELYLVKSPTALTKGTKLVGPDGNAVTAPKEYTEQTWQMPAADKLTDKDKEMANEDGTYNLLVYNTNGCHIYFITVGEGDSPVVEGAKKVAYLAGDAASEQPYAFLDGDPRFEITLVDDPAKATLEALADYDVVVIGTTVTGELAAAVKPLIAFIPVVNLNSATYETLGLGKAVETAATQLTIADATSTIFEGFTDVVEYDGAVTGVTLGDYFAADQVLAKAGDAVAIHVHNAGRNAYYRVPIENASEGVYFTLIQQTMLAAAATKKGVTAVATPNITFTQADGVSTVTIKAANSQAIYYTTDGTAPTTASTLYAEPFDVTAETTVKAFATGDGFNDSEVAEKVVTIARQADAPTITVAQEAGKSTVTITTAVTGAKVYFNCNGAATAALSQLYTEPVVLTEPATVYAFVEAEGALASEQTVQAVDIQGFDRKNEIAHFDANETDWKKLDTENGGEIKNGAYYYWGQNGWSYYNTNEKIGEEPELDENGKEKKDDEGKTIMKPIYAPDPAAVRELLPVNENGWKLRSQGQVLTGELTLAPAGGVGNNNAKDRYAEEAVDYISVPSKGAITFGAKLSGEPYTASIETTKQWQGPFDIVAIVGNGNGSGVGQLEIQVSEDGAAWTKVADVKMAKTQRYFKRTRASYNEDKLVYVRVAQTGGGTKGQVYDILLYNNDNSAAGITTPEVGKKAGSTAIYNLSGQQVTKAYKGLVIVGGKKYVNK